MKLNGKTIFLEKDLSLDSLIQLYNYRKDTIAVELNGNIVPKSHYEKTIISDCDTLEIVSFVGGG